MPSPPMAPTGPLYVRAMRSRATHAVGRQGKVDGQFRARTRCGRIVTGEWSAASRPSRIHLCAVCGRGLK